VDRLHSTTDTVLPQFVYTMPDTRATTETAAADNAFRDVALTAQVPIRGTRTLYSVAGDWFSWLCVLSIPYFFFLARRSRRTDAIIEPVTAVS